MMKKSTLMMALALMASASASAQTTSWNFENDEIGADGGFWDRCKRTVVENPLKEGANTSDKCLKFTITGNEWNNGAIATGLSNTGLNTKKRLLLTIKKEQASNVKVQLDCGNDVFKQVVAYYSEAGKWQQLGFDFSQNGDFADPTAITIFATTDAVEGEQEVFIDNIMIVDQPSVNGAALSTLADESISGNVTLTGAWMKGTCLNADGDWKAVNYDDFAAFNAKASDKLTSIDMRGTVTKDVDADQLIKKNPNAILYADEAYDHTNVVAPNASGALVAKEVVLNDAYDFNAPYGFNAEKTSFTRNKMQSSINSFVLPFFVSASDLNVEKIATFKEADGKIAKFETAVSVNGNEPFIAVGRSGDEETRTFVFEGDHAKYIEVTPTEFTGAFKGVYTYQSAKGKFGIDNAGLLHRGGADSHIGAFHAYLEWNNSIDAPAAINIDGEATGINAAAINAQEADGAVFDLSGRRVASSFKGARLQKGIYVLNGKKVVVK